MNKLFKTKIFLVIESFLFFVVIILWFIGEVISVSNLKELLKGNCDYCSPGIYCLTVVRDCTLFTFFAYIFLAIIVILFVYFFAFLIYKFKNQKLRNIIKNKHE